MEILVAYYMYALCDLVPFVQLEKCYFYYTPPWMFLTFLKLYKWYQIAQSVLIR